MRQRTFKPMMSAGNRPAARQTEKLSAKPARPAQLKAKYPGVLLGQHTKTSAPVWFDIEKLLCHIYLLAKSGAGKSFLLNWIMRAIIALRKFGFLFIDPHGDTAKDLLRFGILKRQNSRVVLIDPAEKDFSVRINPLELDDSSDEEIETQVANRVSAVMAMFQAAFGDEEMHKMHQLSRWLRNALKVMAWQRRPLSDLPKFLHHKEFRWQLINQCSDPILKLEWEEFDEAPKRDRTEWGAPLFNRMNELLMHPAIRRIFSARRSSIDLRACMDQGCYVIADLSALPTLERNFLSRCLVDMVYHQAQLRPEGKRREFFLILDEFDEYVSEDIGLILSKLRKFRCSACLAHQSLDILNDKPKVKASVRSNVDIVITGRIARPEAEEMALHHFTGFFRDDIVLDEIKQTKYKPVETKRRVISETEMEHQQQGSSESESSTDSHGVVRSRVDASTEGQGNSWSDGWGDGDFAGDAMGASSGYTIPLHDGTPSGGLLTLDSPQLQMSYGTSSSWQTGHSSFSAYQDGGNTFSSETTADGLAQVFMQAVGAATARHQGRGRSRGKTIAEVPFYVHEEFQEVSSRTFHTAEALKEYATALIFNLPKRCFLVKYGRDVPVPIWTPEVKLVKLPPSLERRSRKKILQACALPVPDVDREFRLDYDEVKSNGKFQQADDDDIGIEPPTEFPFKPTSQIK